MASDLSSSSICNEPGSRAFGDSEGSATLTRQRLDRRRCPVFGVPPAGRRAGRLDGQTSSTTPSSR